MKFFGALSKYELALDKTSLLFDEDSYSYQKLFDKIGSASNELEKLGIVKNDKVALLGKSSAEYVICIFALWNLGAVPVPLNIRLLPQEIEQLLNFTGSKFLIHDDTLSNTTAELKTNSLNFSELINRRYEVQTTFNFNIDEKNLALLLFTSGSTGKPKGVKLTFNKFITSAQTGNQIFLHEENERWLAALPFYHVGGFSIITRCFLFGATLIIPVGLGADEIREALYKFNPTQTSFVTTQLRRLVEAGNKPNRALKHILLGGGFLEKDLVEKAVSEGWPVSKSYGATETTSFVTALTKDEFVNKPDSAGKVLHPNKIFIVDEKRNVLPSGKGGEIVIEAESVAAGYFNNTEETIKKFSGNKYYTGDFGKLDEDGYLFVEARRNDLIISGGENINPVEVENEINKHPQIAESCVFGLNDDVWGQQVCAALILKHNYKITSKGLITLLSNKLSSFKLPKRIFIVDEFPKTELGKVQKEKLKEKILADINSAK